ncbi:MAG: uncharacterized protein A8A55_2262 [Amphiamblys sp. WSBS2006]|nr:MAG: uncharacterized protein A8A55_2262 [Amphiamblys sp. WSBS2006]
MHYLNLHRNTADSRNCFCASLAERNSHRRSSFSGIQRNRNRIVFSYPPETTEFPLADTELLLQNITIETRLLLLLIENTDVVLGENFWICGDREHTKPWAVSCIYPPNTDAPMVEDLSDALLTKRQRLFFRNIERRSINVRHEKGLPLCSDPSFLQKMNVFGTDSKYTAKASSLGSSFEKRVGEESEDSFLDFVVMFLQELDEKHLKSLDLLLVSEKKQGSVDIKTPDASYGFFPHTKALHLHGYSFCTVESFAFPEDNFLEVLKVSIAEKEAVDVCLEMKDSVLLPSAAVVELHEYAGLLLPILHLGNKESFVRLLLHSENKETVGKRFLFSEGHGLVAEARTLSLWGFGVLFVQTPSAEPRTEQIDIDIACLETAREIQDTPEPYILIGCAKGVVFREFSFLLLGKTKTHHEHLFDTVCIDIAKTKTIRETSSSDTTIVPIIKTQRLEMRNKGMLLLDRIDISQSGFAKELFVYAEKSVYVSYFWQKRDRLGMGNIERVVFANTMGIEEKSQSSAAEEMFLPCDETREKSNSVLLLFSRIAQMFSSLFQ